MSLVRIGARFMENRQECIRWCQQYGLLAAQMICPTCNCHCREQALDHAVDGVTWHCPVKVCKKRISIRHGSFFEKSHLQLWRILGLIPICGVEVLESQGECLWQTPSQHELQIGSKDSIVNWNQYCRDIAVSHFIKNPIQIGGPRRIVPDQWIFGGYDPATPRKAFCCQLHA